MEFHGKLNELRTIAENLSLTGDWVTGPDGVARLTVGEDVVLVWDQESGAVQLPEGRTDDVPLATALASSLDAYAVADVEERAFPGGPSDETLRCAYAALMQSRIDYNKSKFIHGSTIPSTVVGLELCLPL